MAEWDEYAEHRSRTQAERDEIYGPATERMLDLAGIRTGNRVLDVAAGTGDQTLLAAQRVGPSGYVLATDISTNMLNAAADSIRRAGLTNVETRVMDGKNLDLEADSFDAVISRLWSFPPEAVRGMRRVVKPGGKVAALVYSTAEMNPFLGIPVTVAHHQGSPMRNMFDLSKPGVLEKAFIDGGFPDVTVHKVSTTRRFSSSADLIRRMKGSKFGRETIGKLHDAEREQAWAEVEQQVRRFEGPNGWEVPGEVLIGVGTK